MKEILVKSSVDGTMQPSLVYLTENEKRPLLVGLHTWSHDRFNQVDKMLPVAKKYDFNLLLPDFRGANLRSNPNCRLAAGSRAARTDIFDAVEYVTSMHKIDTDNIFLLGASGGGHMALMATSDRPTFFKAVASFVPISNMEAWYHEASERYTDDIAACMGGIPDGEHIGEYRERSPIHHIDSIAKANLKIFHGRFDPVVPVHQSLKFYINLHDRYPKARVFLDIFDGGHEMDVENAVRFFFSQMEEKTLQTVTG